MGLIHYLYLTLISAGVLGVLWLRVGRPLVTQLWTMRAERITLAGYVEATRGVATATAQSDSANCTGARNCATGAEAIAMPRNERNALLSSGLVAQTQASMLVRLLASEVLHIPDGRGGYKRATQTTLIRLATGLEPNGRPDSEYSQLVAELRRQQPRSVIVVSPGRPDERVIAK